MEHEEACSIETPISEAIARVKQQRQALTHAITALRVFAKSGAVGRGRGNGEGEAIARATRRSQALARAIAALKEYEARRDVEGIATGTHTVGEDLRADRKSA